MDNYRLLLQKILNKLSAYYEFNKESYDSYDTVKCSINKYNADILELCMNLGSDDLDYRKILIQIIFDLRSARDANLDYDASLAVYDALFLQEIMEVLMHENEEFYNEFGSTYAIKYKEYEALCKEYNLVI
ncbi:MAG: hypothetical protein IKW30_00575 [Lachnospiraceae bacterium]|nr:hypothetical protein [Lachnospiraceae bacterium]